MKTAIPNETLATGGEIGASLLIASCCVAPTLFLLFGISAGGLGMLAVLEPYRPIFMALGGAALAYAGWRSFRRTLPYEDRCRDPIVHREQWSR